MSSLRSILGGSRVTKKKNSSSPATSSQRSASTSSLSSWPRTKPSNPSSSASRTKSLAADSSYDPSSRLPYHGPAHPNGLLPSANPIRTVPQALHHAQATMFDPLPESHSGMSSVRVAQVLNYRAGLPRVTSVAHVGALLSGLGPTAVERAVAEAVRAGHVRRVVVPRRGGVGEVLVDARELEGMIDKAKGVVDDVTREGFVRFLRENPQAIRMPRVVVAGQGGLLLSAKETDKLIRAGFLTSHNEMERGGYSRPEDRYTLMSLESVSRAASGTFDAVGGIGAVTSSGGTGAGRAAAAATGGVSGEGLSLAVPGNGTFLKLVSNALAHLTGLLEKAKYKEMPETSLKEKWDGGVASDAAGLAKRARGEFVGILPGRTKKWKDFYGLSFEWVLLEAIGLGLVEVFDTRSVGNGVRLIS
ncbi:Serine-threonine protein kinase protein [Coniochaeta hoffmannii]|uniref:Serine-threonine protein kinase protein n=1 Tax=Coniochaeta hoffmannii TaxID=91930 RepID=A0AA38RSN2_9PEZI|nr:Serine-threonine protein kinase protein [Coniochaeta hoffmannii]